MKKLLTSLLTVIIILCAVGLVACNTDNGDDNGKHTHKYVETVLVEPNCTEKGRELFTCSCGDSYESDLDALGHDFTNYVSNGDATLTEDGTETAVCNREGCSETNTRVDLGSNLSHTHDYQVSSTISPTCTERGYTIYTCSCEDIEMKNYVDALGHEFTNYVSDNNATQEKDGTKTAVCNRKDCAVTDTKIDEGSKLPSSFEHQHTYEDKWSFDVDYHYRKATCEHTGEIADKTYHTFVSDVCSTCDYEIHGLKFKLNSDGVSYSVTGLSIKNLTDIEIPNFYKNLPVTAISDRAFYSRTSLQSVTISDGIQSIGNEVFSECRSLQSVTIPDSVQSIGYGAFYYSNTKVNYTGTIDKWVIIEFGGSLSLGPLYINNVLVTKANITIATKINNDAFASCDSLQSVTIGNSVQSIGVRAFECCESLQSVTIGNSVQSIDDRAFAGCGELQSVTIGNSVQSIDYGAFAGCGELQSVTIPDSVKSIGSEVFDYCKSLQSVTIGKGVEKISDRTFFGCESLKNVYISDISVWCKIKFYGTSSNPFDYAKNLYLNNQLVTNLVIPDNVQSICKYAFSGCESLQSVVIPNSVQSIGIYAFYDCTSLLSVTFEDTTTWYRRNALQQTGGTQMDVTNATQNAIYLSDIYDDYYWDKE